MGVGKIESTRSIIDEMIGSTHGVTDVVAEIARENREQTHRVQSVSETIEQIDATTQQDSALVEQAAAATESLKDQAEALRQSLAVFRGT